MIIGIIGFLILSLILFFFAYRIVNPKYKPSDNPAVFQTNQKEFDVTDEKEEPTEKEYLFRGALAIKFDYLSAKNELTKDRRVVLLSVWKHPQKFIFYFGGRCLLKNEWRKFRFDKMYNLVIEQTGDIIENETDLLNFFNPKENP